MSEQTQAPRFFAVTVSYDETFLVLAKDNRDAERHVSSDCDIGREIIDNLFVTSRDYDDLDDADYGELFYPTLASGYDGMAETVGDYLEETEEPEHEPTPVEVMAKAEAAGLTSRLFTLEEAS